MIVLQAENLKIIIPLITLGGSLVGFILARLYDRTLSERFVPKDVLLDKLKKRTLSDYGLERLKTDLGTAIVNLKTLFNNPRIRMTLPIVINSGHRFFAKDLSQDISCSNCPDDEGEIHSFFFDSETVSQDVIHNLKPITMQLESSLSGYFANKDTDMNLFQNQNVINANSQLLFWLHTPNYVPADTAKLNEDYNIVNAIIRKWLPGVQLIIEFYVSNDLSSDYNAFVNDSDGIPRTMTCNKWAELVKNRNYILAEFKHGFAFDHLNYGHDLLPEQVVAPRLEEAWSKYTKDILNIYGVPGSGKSFLTDKLIKSHLSGNIFVVINNPEQVNTLSLADTMAGKEEFYESIIDVIASSELPAYCTVNKETINVAQFAITNILKSGSHILNIVIDDYYLYKEVIEAKIKSIVNKNWRIKFIIVGRPIAEDLVKNYYPNKLETFECKSWNRAEALSIINQWSQRTYEEVEDTLTIDWLAQENEFSIYLLRLIERNIGNIEGNKLSDILRKEIMAHRLIV